ncbi:hypothetical protein A2Y85_02505 [candidate division WOR-3 bacterium RBG_13_43_14]|uniref:Uncharacterized protein n=1 Tax=candidate division WOR-3 bacterium RBG_13_43_14 TaxID=1802590 RepID=A0A1F4UBU5_UNCW3|nr:MAG: hypothetical protein A2Y85_02505 [candidate division WOR-3 bacterium RBG_13_43_14]
MTLVVILRFFIFADFPICEEFNIQYQPCVNHYDSLYYIFWSDYRNPISIFATRLLEDGTVLDTGGVFLFRSYANFGCRAAFDGENFLVVLRDSC